MRQESLRAVFARHFRDHAGITIGQRFGQGRIIGQNHRRRTVGNERAAIVSRF